MSANLICIGCQACVDVCPNGAIGFSYNDWGEGKAFVDEKKCTDCGLCEKICPNQKIQVNPTVKTVYAAISKKNRKMGSSGGLFFDLASTFLAEGGVVFGAAFDENLQLKHLVASNQEELVLLCKSKYVHSDMTGCYTEILKRLKGGEKIMFVGTPCQVSALKNLRGEKYKENLLLVDFLCHGTGTQRVFDACIKSEEKKRGGKILSFSFRAKTRRAEHSFAYEIANAKGIKTISGYAFEFPYYHSYLKYTIFNDTCYTCKYAQNGRVGDITLGDFWGIQKYNKHLKDWKGISLLSINTKEGGEFFSKIKEKCFVWEYPISCGTNKNQSFNQPEAYPKRKEELSQILIERGDDALVAELACPNIKKNLLYVKIPNFIKKIYTRVRKK